MDSTKVNSCKNNLKKELAKSFVKYFESISYTRRIEEIEALIYNKKIKNSTFLTRLSLQEKKCIFLAAEGKSVKETAKILKLSYYTIQEYRASAIKKLGVPNIVAAVALSIKYKTDQSLVDSNTNINENLLDLLPACIYWKDLNGVFIKHNSFTSEKMRSFGLSQHIIGKTDYDVFLKKVANIYRKNDIEVLKKKILLTREEPLILPDNRQIIQLSIKKPFLINDEIAGIICITFDTSKKK